MDKLKIEQVPDGVKNGKKIQSRRNCHKVAGSGNSHE